MNVNCKNTMCLMWFKKLSFESTLFDDETIKVVVVTSENAFLFGKWSLYFGIYGIIQ